MDKAQTQDLEWQEAQKIVISEDLVAAAKRQLKFLEAVDKRRCLYDGPVLTRAIHRYKNCWLPLLAEHGESGMLEGPLVVPLDCEWIWHCHRLNPVQYKKDCENVYGTILSNKNVRSSVDENSPQETLKIWRKAYPNEPFELDYTTQLPYSNADIPSVTGDVIKYDLISAVKRQCSFCYQVSRPSMHDDRFLTNAVARYKGFLHLIKRNQESLLKQFTVPTYDIDLIWHSHQLQSPSYCKDLVEVLGRVLEHDDTDSDRTKGKKLDVGFSETTKQWEETFGSRYWRAGAMYRGNPPSPLMVTPLDYVTKNATPLVEYQKHQLPQIKVVEVLLEVVGIRNLPDNLKGDLLVSVGKKQPDMFFDGSCKVSIFSECRVKKVASFQCEPNGELTLALMSSTTSKLMISRRRRTIGKALFSLESLVDPDSNLSIEKWFELKPSPGNADSKPIYLHVAVSSTVPIFAPHMLYMASSWPFLMNTCFFPLPRKVQLIRCWTRFLDDSGNEIISIQMRNSKNTDREREIVSVSRSSKEARVLAKFTGNMWSLSEYNLSLSLENTGNDGHLFELRGCNLMRLYVGRKLEFEPRTCMKHRKNENDFITVVGFTSTDPHGKAVALLNVKSGLAKVSEEWFVLPGILLTFILSNMKKEGYDFFTPNSEKVAEAVVSNKKADRSSEEDQLMHADEATPEKGAGCGSGWGNNAVHGNGHKRLSSGCGSGGCGGGCGNMVTSSKCGGGCGNMVEGGKCGGCGAGCGGGCRMGKYGGGCGGGCGNMMKSGKSGGGCGSGCGGGCGGGCGDGLTVGKAGS